MLDQFIGAENIPTTVRGIPAFLQLVEKAMQAVFDAGFATGRAQGRLDVLVPEAAIIVFCGAIWGLRRLLR